jgi:hypothetical protein
MPEAKTTKVGKVFIFPSSKFYYSIEFVDNLTELESFLSGPCEIKPEALCISGQITPRATNSVGRIIFRRDLFNVRLVVHEACHAAHYIVHGGYFEFKGDAFDKEELVATFTEMIFAKTCRVVSRFEDLTDSKKRR